MKSLQTWFISVNVLSFIHITGLFQKLEKMHLNIENNAFTLMLLNGLNLSLLLLTLHMAKRFASLIFLTQLIICFTGPWLLYNYHSPEVFMSVFCLGAIFLLPSMSFAYRK